MEESKIADWKVFILTFRRNYGCKGSGGLLFYYLCYRTSGLFSYKNGSIAFAYKIVSTDITQCQL
jgi:hypothetical protein